MKNFVFYVNGRYEAVYSTSQKQAEKDMGLHCIAAFVFDTMAEDFAEMMNKTRCN